MVTFVPLHSRGLFFLGSSSSRKDSGGLMVDVSFLSDLKQQKGQTACSFYRQSFYFGGLGWNYCLKNGWVRQELNVHVDDGCMRVTKSYWSVMYSVVTVARICNSVSGGVFLTFHHVGGAGGEYQSVSRLGLLIRNFEFVPAVLECATCSLYATLWYGCT